MKIKHKILFLFLTLGLLTTVCSISPESLAHSVPTTTQEESSCLSRATLTASGKKKVIFVIFIIILKKILKYICPCIKKSKWKVSTPPFWEGPFITTKTLKRRRSASDLNIRHYLIFRLGYCNYFLSETVGTAQDAFDVSPAAGIAETVVSKNYIYRYFLSSDLDGSELKLFFCNLSNLILSAGLSSCLDIFLAFS